MKRWFFIILLMCTISPNIIWSKYDPISRPKNSPDTVKLIVEAMEEGKIYDPVKDEDILRKILVGQWAFAIDDPMKRIEVKFFASGKIEVYDDYSLGGEQYKTYKGKWALKDGFLLIDANVKYLFKVKNYKLRKEESTNNFRKKMLSPLIQFEPYKLENGINILWLYLDIYKW